MVWDDVICCDKLVFRRDITSPSFSCRVKDVVTTFFLIDCMHSVVGVWFIATPGFYKAIQVHHMLERFCSLLLATWASRILQHISNRHVKLIDDTTISLTIRGPKINTVSSVPLSLSDGILLLRNDEAAVYTYIAEHTGARAVRYKSLDCLMTAEENYYFNSINYCSV